jgi:hypothetical protein
MGSRPFFYVNVLVVLVLLLNIRLLGKLSHSRLGSLLAMQRLLDVLLKMVTLFEGDAVLEF